MNKLFYLLFLTILVVSCAKKLIPNSKGEESLIGKINEKIKSGTIGEDPLILLNADTVDSKDLNLLNEFALKDFTSIDFIPKSEGIQKYGDAGKDGVVTIHPFIDETLSMQYYEGITNTLLLQKIEVTVKQGLTKRNPIIVLDGHPLRGDEIVSKINAIGPSKLMS